MTTLKDYLNDLVTEAMTKEYDRSMGRITASRSEIKEELVEEYLTIIRQRIIGE